MKSAKIVLATLLLQSFFFSCASAELNRESEYTSPKNFSIPINGLPNVGNSCYMNAVLQCLFQIPEFAQLIKEESNQDIPFLYQCKNIVNAFEQTDDEAVLAETTELFGQVTECLFDNSDEQQDALELFTQIINGIPQLQPLFSVSLNTEISCARCDTVLKSANQTIYDLHLEALQTQTLNGMCCPSCQTAQTKAYKKSKLNNYPQYLLINCDQIHNENGLDAADNLSLIQSKLSDYEHVGTILYAGTRQNGHYIAYVKKFSTGQWYLCNDVHIFKFNNLATEKQTSDISNQNQRVAFSPRILLCSKKH